MIGILFQGWCIPLRRSSGDSLSSKKGTIHKLKNQQWSIIYISEIYVRMCIAHWFSHSVCLWFWSKGSSPKAVRRKSEIYAIINVSRWVMTFWTEADLKHSNSMAESNYASWITHRLNILRLITSYRSKSPK